MSRLRYRPRDEYGRGHGPWTPDAEHWDVMTFSVIWGHDFECAVDDDEMPNTIIMLPSQRGVYRDLTARKRKV